MDSTVKDLTVTGTLKLNSGAQLVCDGQIAVRTGGEFQVASDATWDAVSASGIGGYQPLDADLTAIAAISGTSGWLTKTAANTWALATVTTAGAAILDDADAAAQRTTLGLGASATLAVGTGSGTVAAGDHTHSYGPSDVGINSTGTPAAANSTGTAGTIKWDADYVYVCVATDTWKRAAISTWT